MGEFRKRIVQPFSIPLYAAVIVGALVFSFSRILLAIPEKGSTTVALLMAAEILGVCAVVASITRVTASQKIVLVAFGLALIAGGAGAAEIGVREIESSEAAATIVAKGIKFTTTSVTIPADKESQIKFVNEDVGVPHNVVVTNDEKGFDIVFDPQGTINGVASVTYKVPALKKGEYFFHCAVHPDMKGELLAGEGAEGPPAGSGSTPAPSATDTAMTHEPAGAPSAEADVMAKGAMFDPIELAMLAGKKDTIHFDNQDTGVPHNIVITTAEDGGTEVFRGARVDGVAHAEYSFTGPAAGKYFFHCEFHPTTMKGTIEFS